MNSTRQTKAQEDDDKSPPQGFGDEAPPPGIAIHCDACLLACVNA